MARSPTVRHQPQPGLAAAGLLVAAALGLTGAAAATEAPPPEIRAFKPVADTYASAARPRTNFGRARVLRVDGAPEKTAYLRFDIGNTRGGVDSVTLLLRSHSEARASFAVRGVNDDDWRERRLTYANAPRLSLRYTASKPVRRGVWTAVDVTPFVEDGDSEVSLAVTTRAHRELTFGSRESRYGPRLVIRSGDGAAQPSPLPGLPLPD
jgi:hypothetical protein